MAIHIPLLAPLLKPVATRVATKGVATLLLGTGMVISSFVLLVFMANKRGIFRNPDKVGVNCDTCNHFISLRKISHHFKPDLKSGTVHFIGSCPNCSEPLTIKETAITEADK